MRIATCKGPITVSILGTRDAVSIGQGWQGDLDQVVGESGGRACTVADALGPELLQHFEIHAPAGVRSAPMAKARPGAQTPAAHTKTEE